MTTEKLPTTMTNLKSEGIKGLLETYKLQIAQAIPKNITAERLIQVATTVVARNPKIAECTVPSIIGAVMQSAILGFDPTPALGHCAFIPRKNKKTNTMECQFMIQYMGYIELARRSGDIMSVSAEVVYEHDYFEYEKGLEEKLIHKPTLDERGGLKYAYAIWRFKDGGHHFEVMNKQDIMKARRSSESADSEYSPWKNFEEEMWRKTVVRRSRKYVPMSVEIQKGMATDETTLDPTMFKNGELALEMIDTPDFTPEPPPAQREAPVSQEEITKRHRRTKAEMEEPTPESLTKKTVNVPDAVMSNILKDDKIGIMVSAKRELIEEAISGLNNDQCGRMAALVQQWEMANAGNGNEDT